METIELYHGFDMDGDACMYGQVIDDGGNHTRYLNATELTAHVEKLEAALEMVTRLSRLNKDGDIIDPHNGSPVYEYSAEGNDEEVDTLYGFVREARELTGEKPDCLKEGTDANIHAARR